VIDRSVFDELDKLEAALAGAHPAEVTSQVADRLRSVLARIDRPADRPDQSQDLTAISDQELFSVLQNELRGGGYPLPVSDAEEKGNQR
jgi:hypothetical protein